MATKYLSLERFEDFKKNIADRLNEYYSLIKDLEKRGDPFILFKKADESLNSLKDHISDLDKKTVSYLRSLNFNIFYLISQRTHIT